MLNWNAMRRPPAFTWSSLFADGTPGFRINIEEALRINESVGYDPSKCVIFQDSAGTLPVTAMEQPIGYIKDLSGNGNHFVQPSNTASRPIVSRRVNLLTRSQEFVAPTWNISSATVTNNAAVAPDGSLTAALVVADAGYNYNDPNARVLSQFPTVTGGTTYTWSIYAKAAGVGSLAARNNWTGGFTVFNLTDELTTANKQYIGNGWYRCFVTYTPGTTSTNSFSWRPFVSGGTADGVGGVLVWGADLRLSIDANLPPYQRVTSATDYDEVGFPAYAKFDGVDDWLETGGTVDMTSTDEVTVIAGVTKLSDAVTGTIVEFGPVAPSTNGTFGLYGPSAGARPDYGFVSRGTNSSAANTLTTPAAPTKNLLTAFAKISTDTSVLRINGVQAASGSADQGTGNYTAQKFYMGRRAGTTPPFNGRVYGITVIGKLLTDGQLAAAEQAERHLGRLYW